MPLYATSLPSPVGTLTLVATDNALMAVLWEKDDPARVPLGPLTAAPDHPILRETATQLDDYFADCRTAFDLPLAFTGTDFQKAVWSALLAIPHGETRSYGDLARLLGRPGASRAVGAANGRNPISIIAACHRVVGSAGSLTGFAGGLAAKRWLLNHERGQLVLVA